MRVEWANFKAFVDSKGLSIQYVEFDGQYWLKGIDGNFSLECFLEKTAPNTSDLDDFVGNYKPNGNKKLDQKDSGGASLQRVKITTTGWHYQLHGIEFETSKLNSNYSKKVDNTDYNFTAMTFYKDVSGVETLITGDDLNQTFLTANCIKTIIDWEPAHDLEVIGGLLKQKTIPTEPVYLWVVGVPDVSEAYGGSKPFAASIDMCYIGLEEGVKVDGRAPKYMSYSAIYHTTKLRLMFRHSAGFSHKMHMIFELFKA